MCRLARLLGLLHLLLQLRDLCPGLIKGDVLHENRLRQNVERVGVRPQGTVKQSFRIGVFFLQLGLINTLDERIQKLFFLGSQGNNLRRS